MIKITVKLFAHYRAGKFNYDDKEYPEGITIGKVIEDIKIDIDTYPVGIILVNGRHASEEYKL